MHLGLSILVALLGLAACAPQPVMRGGSTGGAPSRRADGAGGNPLQAGSAERLAARAAAVDEAVQSSRHEQLSQLLGAMTEAISTLPLADASRRAAAVREVRDRFERAEPASVTETRLLMDAARAILTAIEADGSASNPPGLDAAKKEVQEALHRISPQSGVLAQADAVRDLTHVLTDALLIALGHEPVFTGGGAATEGAAASTGGERSFQGLVTSSRQLVFRLADGGWHHATLAARILNQLADALEMLGTAAEIEPQLQEIRFQAKRLVRSRDDFTRGEWGKRGLLAALFALERGLPLEQRAVLAPWLETARAAAGALDERRALGFQRARTQDAFRCVTDAFLVVAQVREQRPSALQQPSAER